MNKLTLAAAVEQLKKAATGPHSEHWAHTPAVKLVLAELERLQQAEAARKTRTDRQVKRAALESPEGVNERRRKNHERALAELEKQKGSK